MDDQKQDVAIRYAHGSPSLFPILDPIFFKEGQRIEEHASGVFKGHTMLR